MTKHPLRASLTLVTCAALALTGCSGQGTSTANSEYCNLLTGNTALLTSMSDPTAVTADSVATLRKIEAVAPADVKADWKTFNDYLQAFTERDAAKAGDINALLAASKKIDANIASVCDIKTS